MRSKNEGTDGSLNSAMFAPANFDLLDDLLLSRPGRFSAGGDPSISVAKMDSVPIEGRGWAADHRSREAARRGPGTCRVDLWPEGTTAWAGGRGSPLRRRRRLATKRLMSRDVAERYQPRQGVLGRGGWGGRTSFGLGKLRRFTFGGDVPHPGAEPGKPRNRAGFRPRGNDIGEAYLVVHLANRRGGWGRRMLAPPW